MPAPTVAAVPATFAPVLGPDETVGGAPDGAAVEAISRSVRNRVWPVRTLKSIRLRSQTGFFFWSYGPSGRFVSRTTMV